MKRKKEEKLFSNMKHKEKKRKEKKSCNRTDTKQKNYLNIHSILSLVTNTLDPLSIHRALSPSRWLLLFICSFLCCFRDFLIKRNLYSSVVLLVSNLHFRWNVTLHWRWCCYWIYMCVCVFSLNLALSSFSVVVIF